MSHNLSLQLSPEISIEPRKSGLAIKASSPVAPNISATLLLRWSELSLIVALLVVGGLIVYFRHQLGATWLVATWAPAHLKITVTILTVSAFFLGFFITLWKKKQLFTYSIAEIAFALFTVFQISLHLWPEGRLSNFVALGSALYVVSRGFGNFWDAFTNETEIERLKVQLAELDVSFVKRALI